MFCNGQLISISSNAALFSILGTTYGGDGVSTFALPNLQSRVPIGMGQGPGLSSYTQGQIGGTENNTILLGNMPPHNHQAVLNVSNGDSTIGAATAGASIATPGALNGRSFAPTLGFNTTTPATALNNASVVVGVTGSGLPVNNIQPYVAMNYIICVYGIFPSRS